jgi:uncharacterized protein (DUF1810 family)
MTDDPHDLARFVTAQQTTIDAALAELRAGRKTSHWMWFVFPQLRGLGSSATAQFYGIASLAEARAYLAHGVLSPRLRECVEAVRAVEGRSLREIFGTPDDMKFRSSMTLFSLAAEDGDDLFANAIRELCDGRPDDRTIALVRNP